MKYQIRYEPMGGQYYYMIYRKSCLIWEFFERWNSGNAAVSRVNELKELEA